MKKPEWLRVPYFDNEKCVFITDLLKTAHDELGMSRKALSTF